MPQWTCCHNLGRNWAKYLLPRVSESLRATIKLWERKEVLRRYRRKTSFRSFSCSARRVCPGRHSSQNPSLAWFHHSWFCVQFTAHHNGLKSKTNTHFSLRFVHYDIFKNSWFHQKFDPHVMPPICRNLSKSKIRIIVAPFSPHRPTAEEVPVVLPPR